MDKCCCPCACTLYIPLSGGYCKLTPDICAPFMIKPQEDGTIDGTMQGIYQKKPGGSATAAGAPPSSEEMAR